MSDAPLTVYKVLRADEMAALERDGRFEGSADDQRDGYIHLSTGEQLTATVDKHFAGVTDLHVAAVDVAAQGEALKWEAARGGQPFPHLYGVLRLDTVVAYSPLERDEAGEVRRPVTG